MLGVSALSYIFGGVGLFLFVLIQWELMVVGSGLRRNIWIDPVPMKWAYLILTIYILISVMIGSIVEPGYDRFILLMLHGQPAGVSVLFSFRRRWWNALLLRLFMAVRVLLWSLLLVIPGIAAMLNYALAPYLMAQDPAIEPPEAIRVSKILMKGYKKQLLFLIIRYADEIFIGILTLGIGFLFVTPRIKTAIAVFYRERVAVHDEEVLKAQTGGGLK